MSEELKMPFLDRCSALAQRIEAPVIDGLMREALSRPGILSLGAGFTDNALLPVEEVAEVIAELNQSQISREHLQYGTNQGRLGLRSAIAQWMRHYPNEEAVVSADQIVITNGSQQGLYLNVQFLCNPGDIVLVEAPSYFIFLEMLRGMGVHAVSLPQDDAGEIDYEAFAEMVAQWKARGEIQRVKLIYLVSYFANPSTRCWSFESKQMLGDFLNEAQLPWPVVEDAAYRDLSFERDYPVPSLLSVESFQGRPVLYAGTFTKPYATGIKVGYLISSTQEWITGLLRIKAHHDFGTANLNQAIIERVLESGRYAKHLERIRRVYAAKLRELQDCLVESGLKDLGWDWMPPEGGLLLWVRGPHDLDTGLDSVFCKKCLEHDVLYVPGDICFAEGNPRHFVRLSVGLLSGESLKEAVKRFTKAAQEAAIHY
jgi:2-aminoadipate transaminase